MRTLGTLSRIEVTVLMQVRMSAKLDARYRDAASRLLHFRLIEETPSGWHVTSQGETYCQSEAARLGFAAGIRTRTNMR